MNNALQKEQVLDRTFETQDIQLAACLSALGANLLAIDRQNPDRCTFVFEDVSDLRRTVDAYWRRQLSIEPQVLLGALKTVKSRLYNDSV